MMQFKIFESSDTDALAAKLNQWLQSAEGKVAEIMSQSSAIGQKEIPGGSHVKSTPLFTVTIYFRKR